MSIILTNSDIKEMMIKENYIYRDYEYEEITRLDTDFFRNYMTIYCELIDSKFFGLYESKKRNRKEIPFRKHIFLRYKGYELLEIDVEIAIDHEARVIYWKNKGFLKDEKLSKSSNNLEMYLRFLNINDKPYTRESLQAHRRKLALIYHPDKANGNVEMMKRVNEAIDYVISTL